MKTRSKRRGPTNASKKNNENAETKATVQTLDPSVSNPPQVSILPKETSPDARILTLPNPATSQPCRYLICPERGCFEFTRVAAPARACRSWLLAPDRPSRREETTSPANGAHSVEKEEEDEGYVLHKPDLMIATPIDPLFLVLPALLPHAEQGSGRKEKQYLSTSDYLDELESRSGHFKQLMRSDGSRNLERIFEIRIEAICDSMEAGDEKLYTLSLPKLAGVLVEKAKKMVESGLPASMEERFVKQALAVPVLSVRREESGVSLADRRDDLDKAVTTTSAESESASISQDTSQTSSSSSTTAAAPSPVSTAATSFPSSQQQQQPPLPNSEQIHHLLRLRTALTYLLTSYIPPSIHTALQTHISANSSIDFVPLETHLTHLTSLKKEAQALSSLSQNISRKRGAIDEEEAEEVGAEKKRRKEEEDVRKKNTSRGVQQLKKADTSGMKKLSSFFWQGCGEEDLVAFDGDMGLSWHPGRRYHLILYSVFFGYAKEDKTGRLYVGWLHVV